MSDHKLMSEERVVFLSGMRERGLFTADLTVSELLDALTAERAAREAAVRHADECAARALDWEADCVALRDERDAERAARLEADGVCETTTRELERMYERAAALEAVVRQAVERLDCVSCWEDAVEPREMLRAALAPTEPPGHPLGSEEHNGRVSAEIERDRYEAERNNAQYATLRWSGWAHALLHDLGRQPLHGEHSDADAREVISWLARMAPGVPPRYGEEP